MIEKSDLFIKAAFFYPLNNAIISLPQARFLLVTRKMHLKTFYTYWLISNNEGKLIGQKIIRSASKRKKWGRLVWLVNTPNSNWSKNHREVSKNANFFITVTCRNFEVYYF